MDVQFNVYFYELSFNILELIDCFLDNDELGLMGLANNCMFSLSEGLQSNHYSLFLSELCF